MIERIEAVNPERYAALCTSAHLGRERWRPVDSCWEGELYIVGLEREAQEPVDQAVRPVAEQAAAMGLVRAEGAADVIWSGRFGYAQWGETLT